MTDMTEQKFQVGDVVRLKGVFGPQMLVEDPRFLSSGTCDFEVWCVWFDGSYDLHGDSFPSVLLEKVTP